MSTTTRGDLSVTNAQASQTSWYHGFTQAATTKYWAAAARISIGFVFLWAFLDKNFGWQFTTPKGQGWMFATGDGSPTFGFLTFGTNPDGPFASFFNNLGEQAGVANAIEILRKEFDVTMALCGVKSTAEINREVLADTESQRRPQ